MPSLKSQRRTSGPGSSSKDRTFDEGRALHAVRFINALTHTKDQWAGEPFTLRPWQEGIVRELFGRMREDNPKRRAYRTCFIEVPRKNGKALDVDTMIPTACGWSPMADLAIGDVLFDERGHPCNVIKVGPIQHDRPCYRVSFGDGTEIVADEEHEWLAGHKDWSAGPRIVTTLGLKPGCRLEVTAALECEDVHLRVPPYTLGAWLGDGRCDGASLSSVDEEIYTAIAAEGVPIKRSKWEARLGGDRSLAARSVSVQATMRSMGLFEGKRIPQEYQRASLSQRFSLLQGLMDTDGYCSKAGQCELTTIYPMLASDALELIRGLGLKASCSVGRALMNGKDCGPKYRIQFWAWAGINVFSIPRKVERQKSEPARPTRATGHYVQSVDFVKSRPVRCIQVDSPSRLYLAGEGMIPTHNSEICAAFALYGLIADGVQGAEIYSAAADREQASLVFNVAAQMVRNDEQLSARLKVIDSQKRIVDHRTGSFYRAISAEAYSKHGFNASLVLYDELHAAPDRELWDVLTTSQGARWEPLTIAITTAGFDRNSICWEKHDYAIKVRDGLTDPSFFPVIYAAPDDADWLDEDVWRLANPALEDFRDIEEMRSVAHQAKEIPALQNTFRRLYLNQWTEQAERWIDMAAWDRCGTALVDPLTLKGQPCFAGLDLSTTTDLSALVLVFPRKNDSYAVLPFFWCPDEGIEKRSRADRVNYAQWKRQGLLTGTPGNVVDYDQIRADVNALGKVYKIREIAYDPWNAMQLAVQLQGDGFQMLECRQGYKTLNEPTKALGGMIVDGGIQHGGNAMLRWCASNMVVTQDPAGNLKPDKSRATERIDGIVALVMALSRAIVSPATKKSGWATGGAAIVQAGSIVNAITGDAR